jgi:starch-binding outer membrane protein, SusD/RagB family
MRNHERYRHTGRSLAGSRLRTALLTMLVIAGTGCNSLLEVETPGRVPTSELDNPAMAPGMLLSAMGEFECAYSQYVVSTGILAGEYIISGFSINSNIWGWRGEVELRATPGNCGGGYGYYTPLQKARFQAEDGFRRVEAFPDAEVPNKTNLLAQLAAYAGYSLTLLGEGFCEMALDEGPLMTRAQVFARAEERFTTAITLAQTAGNTEFRNMALAGRARVRLNLGRGAEAVTDASAVPVGFVKNAVHSTAVTRRENRVYNATVIGRDLSVDQSYRNLTVGGSPDTRVRVVSAGIMGTDLVTPQWDQMKYTSKAAPIPIASWDEMQLIIAEVQGGSSAITILNNLRSRASLPALTPLEEADIAQTVIEERRRELFSEGHRYGTMLRLGIPFPSGQNHKGQFYGNVTCMPLPDVERLNNPNID